MYKQGTVLKNFEKETKEKMDDAHTQVFVSAFLFHIIENVDTLEAAFKRNEYRDRVWGYGVIRDLYKAQLDIYYNYMNPESKVESDEKDVDKKNELE